MNDSTALQPGTVALEPPSTVLNPETVKHVSGAGKTSLSENVEGESSIGSVLETELARLKAEDAEKDAKAEKPEAATKDKAEAKDAKPAKEATEEKPAKARDETTGKFAKAEKGEEQPEEAKADKGAPAKAATGQEVTERRQSEGRHPEPPARFLPEARAKWANVPNEVKAEFHRVSQEMEQERTQFQASHDRYQQLKEHDERYRASGKDMRESLNIVRDIEVRMGRNPVDGLNAVLREIGPRKSDGTPLTLMEVANYLVQNPQAYEQAQQRQAYQQPQQQFDQSRLANPEIEALRAEVHDLRAQHTIVPVIDAFAADKPDFDAVGGKVADILASGVIDKLYGNGLSLQQKLSEAYRMAGGQSSSSRSDTETLARHSDASRERPVNPDAGTKSVRGAPADGSDTSTEDEDTDLTSILRKEVRKLKVFS